MLKVNKSIGINVTDKCQAKCQTCYYRFSDSFAGDYNKPLYEVIAEIQKGKARGCTNVVLIGRGEPMLYPDIEQVVEYCISQQMTISIITNGLYSPEKLDRLYGLGLDHILLSAHGLNSVLDAVLGVVGASKRHEGVKSYLKENQKVWRANITMQKANYEHLVETTKDLISNGCRHINYILFQPFYEWIENPIAFDVAVSPASVRPFLEESIKICKENDIHITVRYFPLCHLSPENWAYVTNAKYVLYDPFEWDYDCQGLTYNEVWEKACNLADNISIKGEPCCNCNMLTHCGGWNKTYADMFNGVILKAITDDVSQTPGFFFEQNKNNQLEPNYNKFTFIQNKSKTILSDIIIPTYQKRGEIQPLLENLKKNSVGNKIISTNFKISASANRNYGLQQSETEIVIMVDDDILGYYPGWADELIQPLFDPAVVMVSARLLTPQWNPAVMMNIQPDFSKDYQVVDALPSACVAFRFENIYFDENFEGSGWEDTDYCYQLKQKYPKGIFLINNRVKLIHLNEAKEQNLSGVNGKYFHKKWEKVLV